MNKSDILMLINFVITIIGFIVIAIGWFITSKLDKEKIKELQNQARSREYYDDQLQYLYGPIYMLLKESEKYFKILREKLNRDIIIPSTGLSDTSEIELYNFFTKNYFLPINKKIAEIIEANTHLFPGKKYPKSFENFVMYYCEWNSIYELNEVTKEFLYVPSPYNYPSDFVKEVYEQINILKAKQWKIISNYDEKHKSENL